MNTAFEYCYRDAGNWKQYDTVVFEGAPTDDLTARLKRALYDVCFAGAPPAHASGVVDVVFRW